MTRLLVLAIASLIVITRSISSSDKHYHNVEEDLIANNALDKYQNIVVRKCPSPYLCWPGRCLIAEQQQFCLCPDGFEFQHGQCISNTENRKFCENVNCYPGQCFLKNGLESCLCPEDYISYRGACKEIIDTSTKQISTIMLMIIVAIASMMFTTFLSVCICYFTSRNN